MVRDKCALRNPIRECSPRRLHLSIHPVDRFPLTACVTACVSVCNHACVTKMSSGTRVTSYTLTGYDNPGEWERVVALRDGPKPSRESRRLSR